MERSKSTIRLALSVFLFVFIGAAFEVKAQGVLNASYIGNINGAPAMVAVSFEQLPNYTIMAGQIQSANFLYTFRADLVGYSGFGEMASLAEGTRFQIKIDLTSMGFALTSNPLGPGMPTTYYFIRK